MNREPGQQNKDYHRIADESEIASLLRPETELEETLIGLAMFRRGLMWGEPRFGHPEGQVVLHVREVMDNIDGLDTAPAVRRQLRLIALAHDTFKYLEDKSYPRNWNRHHGLLARWFLEDYTSDEAVLDVVELHDEAYYAWRSMHLYKKVEEGRLRFRLLLDRLVNNRELYFLFFQCDTETGDKNQAPLRWVNEVL